MVLTLQSKNYERVAPPRSYGYTGGYSYIVFLWLSKYSYKVFVWYQRVAPPQVTDPVEGIPIEYSYGCLSILIEYSYGTKGLRPPQVTDPVEGIPIGYSYGCRRILIEYSYGCPNSPPPQVTDPMDAIPIEYSYGCPGRGAQPLSCQYVVFLYYIRMAAQVGVASELRVGSNNWRGSSVGIPMYHALGWFLFIHYPNVNCKALRLGSTLI